MSINLMQKTAVAVAVVALFAMPQFGYAADPLVVQNDEFAITLPAGFSAFAEQSQNSESADGTIKTTNWVSKAPTGEAIIVTVSRMPGRILDAEKMMDSTRDSLLKSVGARLESEEDVAGDMPATRLMFRGEQAPVFLRSHLLVDGDRLYQVLYVGRSEEQRAAPVTVQMFESFRIADDDAAPAGTATDAPAAAASTR